LPQELEAGRAIRHSAAHGEHGLFRQRKLTDPVSPSASTAFGFKSPHPPRAGTMLTYPSPPW